MQPMQWQEHKFFTPKSHQKQLMLMGEERGRTKKPQRSQIPHSLIPPKATNACGGRREEEQRSRTTKELLDLHLVGSPHLEERWIGGNVDLDLLSLFPQRYARIMGGIERGQAFPRSTMAGERGEKRATQGRRRGGVFIALPVF